MAQKFIGKKPQNRYIRPICNTRIKRYTVQPEAKVVSENTETEKENTEDMDKRISQINQVLAPATSEKGGKRRTRVEKKADGLYEHAQDAVTVLTEDNKMLLND